MYKSFNLYWFVRRAVDILLFNSLVNLCYLRKGKFLGEYYYFCKLCIEFYCFYIGDICLCGQVNIYVQFVGILYYIRFYSDDSVNLMFGCCVYNMVYYRQIVVVEYGIECDIGMYFGSLVQVVYFWQVFQCKVVGRVGMYIQLFYFKVNCICVSVYCSGQVIKSFGGGQ